MRQGAIKKPAGFEMQSAVAVDPRYEATSITDMLNTPSPVLFEGLPVYVKYDTAQKQTTGRVYKLKPISLCNLALGEWGKHVTHWEEESKSGTGDASFLRDVTQLTHGFIVGDVVGFDGGKYVKCVADETFDVEVIAIIVNVSDTNNFTLRIGGFFNTSGILDVSGNPLAPEDTYYLSDVVAGKVTTQEPNRIGAVSKPVFVTTTSSEGYMLNYRGLAITANTAGATSSALASTTYSAFKSLYNASKLTPGMQYLITDYRTVQMIPGTPVNNVGPIEPIVVMATGPNKLSPYASSTIHPGDRIGYSLTKGDYGLIIYRYDVERNIETDYDFRACKVRRFLTTNLTISTGLSEGYYGSRAEVVGRHFTLRSDIGNFIDVLTIDSPDISNVRIRQKRNDNCPDIYIKGTSKIRGIDIAIGDGGQNTFVGHNINGLSIKADILHSNIFLVTDNVANEFSSFTIRASEVSENVVACQKLKGVVVEANDFSGNFIHTKINGLTIRNRFTENEIAPIPEISNLQINAKIFASKFNKRLVENVINVQINSKEMLADFPEGIILSERTLEGTGFKEWYATITNAAASYTQAPLKVI